MTRKTILIFLIGFAVAVIGWTIFIIGPEEDALGQSIQIEGTE